MDVKERVVMITGATGGLGQVVAETLARNGARLVLVSRSEEQLSILAHEVRLPEERVAIFPADLADPQSARAAVRAAVEAHGRLEIVIHLIGGWSGGKTVTEIEPRALAEMLVNHVWTTFHLAQASLPELQKNGWGRWLAVSSPFAAHPPAKMAAYSVAKSAQETLLLTMAQELKGSGVTANIIRVQTIDTKHEKLADPDAKKSGWTTPEEISAGILYLCSEAAGIVNGAILPMFGSP